MKKGSSIVWGIIINTKTQDAGVHPYKGMSPPLFQIRRNTTPFVTSVKVRKSPEVLIRNPVWIISDVVCLYLVLQCSPDVRWLTRDVFRTYLVVHYSPDVRWVITDFHTWIRGGPDNEKGDKCIKRTVPSLWLYSQHVENSKRTFPSKVFLSNPSSKMLANGKHTSWIFYTEESKIEIKCTLFYYENIK